MNGRNRFLIAFGFWSLAQLGLAAPAVAAPEPAKTAAGGAGNPSSESATANGGSGQANDTANAPESSPQPSPAAANNPHGSLENKDTSVDAPELPAGTLEVLVTDPDGKAIAAQQVELDIQRSSIAEGDSQSSRTALSDETGFAVFDKLPTTTDYAFKVVVKVDLAQFTSDQFQLRPDKGHRQTLHVYPITRSQKDAQVVGRGVIAIHPQDDVFLIDILYQLINLSKQAWVPDNVSLTLPQGWKAFTTQDAAASSRFDQSDPVGAKLIGTFSPGAHEVGFRFQIDNPHTESQSFRLPLLPQTVEMRVIVASSPQMSLSVEDYDPSFVDRLRSGERVLVSEKSYLRPRKNSPEMLPITIRGMPTKGHGHIVTLFIALLIASAGALNLLLLKPQQAVALTDLAPEDLSRARDLLLDELVALERAREKKAIGTKAYEQTRQILLTSLARLT